MTTAMAVAMILSALAVWQGTRAADDAEQLLDQARVLQAQSARTAGYVQTIVAHDLEVLGEYCGARSVHDAALTTVLDGPEGMDVTRLIESTLTLEALGPLLQGDRIATCPRERPLLGGDWPGYSVERAEQRLTDGGQNPAALDASAQALTDLAVDLRWREYLLTGAGFLFVFVLAALIVIDQLADRSGRPRRLRGPAIERWRSGMAISGAALFTGASVLLVTNAVDDRLVWAILIGVASGLLAEWAWLRRPATDVHRPAKGRPQWWAEIVGACALVVFSASAVGLSLVSAEQREAVARADRQAAIADELQGIGQQAALRDLTSLSTYARADAAAIAASQIAGSAQTAAVSQLAKERDELESALLRIEQTTRNQFSVRDTDPLCPTTVRSAALPAHQLYQDFGEKSEPVAWHIWSHQQATRVCDVAAAVERQTALRWSEHGSQLTVALVILGLSGFMLALASNRDRERRAARMLLGLGSIGTVAGLLISATVIPDLLLRVNIPSDDDVRSFAGTVASGQQDPCSIDEGELSSKLRAFSSIGTAFETEGSSVLCRDALRTWPAYTSAVRTESIPAAVEAFAKAVEVGPSTPTLLGSLGWVHILQGIEAGDETQLREGLRRTEEAIAQAAQTADRAGTGPHLLRLNRALAYAALGEHDTAVAAYELAVACLDDPPAECAGGDIADPAARNDIVLWGLADIELLDPSNRRPGGQRLDDYRKILVGKNAGQTVVLDGIELDVFPQELQVTGSLDQGEASVVWYHRADGREPWSVLALPSAETLTEGAHLEHPVPTHWPLDAGEYRADVYAGTRKVSVSATYDIEEGYVRHVSRRLGVSAVVPEDWVVVTDDGVSWELTPADEPVGVTPALRVKRTDGVVDAGDPARNLTGRLEDWVGSDSVGEGAPDEDDWFLGLWDIVVVDDVSGNRSSAGIAPYASAPGCGGTVFMATLRADWVDRTEYDPLRELSMLREPESLPSPPHVFSTDSFEMSPPAGWDAVLQRRGDAETLVARECTSGSATLSVDQALMTGDFEQAVDDTVGALEASGAFGTLAFHDPPVVDVAESAETSTVRYTWRTPAATMTTVLVLVGGESTLTTVAYTGPDATWTSDWAVVSEAIESLLVY